MRTGERTLIGKGQSLNLRRWLVWISVTTVLAASLLLGWGTFEHGAAGSEHTIPAGTALSVRVVHPLDSRRAQLGDVFEARVASAVTVGGAVVIPRGAQVEGRCVAARQANEASRPGYLRLTLIGLRNSQGRLCRLETTAVSVWGNPSPGPGSNASESLGAAEPGGEMRPQLSGDLRASYTEAAVSSEALLHFVLLKSAVVAGSCGLP